MLVVALVSHMACFVVLVKSRMGTPKAQRSFTFEEQRETQKYSSSLPPSDQRMSERTRLRFLLAPFLGHQFSRKKMLPIF